MSISRAAKTLRDHARAPKTNRCLGNRSPALWLLSTLLAFGTAHAQEYAFNTVAGGFDGEGLPATSTNVSFPVGIAFDPSGRLYVADYARERIRRVEADGTMHTVVGNGIPDFRGDGRRAEHASIRGPLGVAFDASGNFYFSDSNNNRVRRVSPDGIITTVAGNGSATFSGDGGLAIDAGVRRPYGLVVDPAGNLYIADSLNNRVRMVTPQGVISTVAGSATPGFSGDGGAATEARLRQPAGLALDAAGNLFISDSANHRIRKVTPAGIITTFAGNGTTFGWGSNGDGGPATSARIASPFGVALDAAGNLYVSDSHCLIRMVAPSGIISTTAGNGFCEYGGGEGAPATMSAIEVPEGLAFSPSGDLHIADGPNGRVRKVSQGTLTTVAGVGSFVGDGGLANDAVFSTITGVTVDGGGNLYIADSDRNNRIRKVATDGVVTTIAGGGGGGDYGPAIYAGLVYPTSSALDNAGNLYITEIDGERIRRVSPGGIITTVAGDESSGSSGDGGPATGARVYAPSRLAIDGNGNIYFADTGNNKIRRIGTDGIITTVAGNGVAGFSGDGGPATSARLSKPFGVAVDAAGNLWIADTNNYRIRKVDPAGVISTIAGNGVFAVAGDGGAAVDASIGRATGIAVGPDGAIHVASGALRRITPDGKINTVQGLRYPAYDVAVDASGAIYVASLGGRILKGQPLPPPVRRSPQLIKSPR